MTADLQPSAAIRRQFYVEGLVAAQYFFDTSQPERRKGVTDYLQRLHLGMPYLAFQLTTPEVREQIVDGTNPVEFRRPPYQAWISEVAGALSIASTGLDRFVKSPFAKKGAWAKPDDTPAQVEKRYRTSKMTLEESPQYRRWLESQQAT
jgi:hypothetical protein